MRRVMLSVWGVFLALMVCSAGLAVEKAPEGAAKTEKAAAPVVFIKEKMYDHGKVSQGETITHDFIVLNKGDSVLEIKSVKPG